MADMPLERQATAAPSRLAGRLVLVVDDSAVARSLLKTMLEGLGAVPLLTATGEDALHRARRMPPDVILVDLSLLGESGGDVARALRAMLGDACPPIVAVSALAAAPDGFDGFLMKPFTPRELYAGLAAVLPA